MNAIEEEARKLGTQIFTISTQDFQALGLYQKLGYEVFGELKDVPFKGTTKYYLTKKA
jgi:ribosomal protein S18 acetylase RimI-like enzyme